MAEIQKTVTPNHRKDSCPVCETHETVYSINLSVIVTLTGKPECHDLQALLESAQARITDAWRNRHAEDVIDGYTVIEVNRDPCSACQDRGWLIVALDGADGQLTGQLAIERCDQCRDETGLSDEDVRQRPEALAALAGARAAAGRAS